jgi:hypothetical protein
MFLRVFASQDSIVPTRRLKHSRERKSHWTIVSSSGQPLTIPRYRSTPSFNRPSVIRVLESRRAEHEAEKGYAIPNDSVTSTTIAVIDGRAAEALHVCEVEEVEDSIQIRG